jgi:hypothetical protein
VRASSAVGPRADLNESTGELGRICRGLVGTRPVLEQSYML